MTTNQTEVMDDYRQFLESVGSERIAATLTVAAQVRSIISLLDVIDDHLDEIKLRLPNRD